MTPAENAKPATVFPETIADRLDRLAEDLTQTLAALRGAHALLVTCKFHDQCDSIIAAETLLDSEISTVFEIRNGIDRESLNIAQAAFALAGAKA